MSTHIVTYEEKITAYLLRTANPETHCTNCFLLGCSGKRRKNLSVVWTRSCHDVLLTFDTMPGKPCEQEYFSKFRLQYYLKIWPCLQNSHFIHKGKYLTLTQVGIRWIKAIRKWIELLFISTASIMFIQHNFKWKTPSTFFPSVVIFTFLFFFVFFFGFLSIIGNTAV